MPLQRVAHPEQLVGLDHLDPGRGGEPDVLEHAELVLAVLDDLLEPVVRDAEDEASRPSTVSSLRPRSQQRPLGIAEAQAHRPFDHPEAVNPLRRDVGPFARSCLVKLVAS